MKFTHKLFLYIGLLSTSIMLLIFFRDKLNSLEDCYTKQLANFCKSGWQNEILLYKNLSALAVFITVVVSAFAILDFIERKTITK